ncbi:terminase large subunit domain-containing protein [Pseudonocardia hispaniensis]|uniref:Terminase large subunit domain-containing protein n=1 Tax=Pseudonocardia hispaniensis TaxID=904933 RepID=A0ABW1J6X0_9PSEU
MSTPEVISEALDVEQFAARVLRRPLWDHQRELLRSPARYRVVCAGRQSGKSATLATAALHTAATRRGALVLLVSAGEEASKRLLADCADLASGALAGGVVDESKATLTWSNGSRILSVPASQRQIRGWPVDLLIVDEAGFIGDELWRAAEPSIIARPGSRVILASSPWGGPEAFFRALWQRGMDSPDEHVESWHWPSAISPLTDAVLLAQIRQREPADYFDREYLAEWPDEAGAYFSEGELMAATADYTLTDPGTIPRSRRRLWPTVGGVDWGLARDGNALVVVSVLDPDRAEDLRWRLFIPWLEVHHRMPYSAFIDRVGGVAGRFGLRVIASEVNGVGQYPTDELQDRLRRNGCGTQVRPVWTDQRRKTSGFSKIKTLLQSDRLILPRHPELLKQLRGLQFEQTSAGGLRIAVPERAGHDDLAMAAMQAVSCVQTGRLRDGHDDPHRQPETDTVSTPAGVRLPRRPWPIESVSWIDAPDGEMTGDGW